MFVCICDMLYILTYILWHALYSVAVEVSFITHRWSTGHLCYNKVFLGFFCFCLFPEDNSCMFQEGSLLRVSITGTGASMATCTQLRVLVVFNQAIKYNFVYSLWWCGNEDDVDVTSWWWAGLVPGGHLGHLCLVPSGHLWFTFVSQAIVHPPVDSQCWCENEGDKNDGDDAHIQQGGRCQGWCGYRI